MDAPAASDPEGHKVWARPQEVGYTIGADIKGEATTVSILFGLITVGADDGGIAGAFLSLLGPVAGTDPLVRSAAGAAISAAGAGVDGIYLTHHETSTLNLLVFKKRTAVVRGRALILRPLGEVSQERADRERFLQALGGRGAQLQIPPALVESAK